MFHRSDDEAAESTAVVPDPPSRRRIPLALDSATFRRAGHDLVDRIAAHLETLGDRPLTVANTPSGVRALFGGDEPIPEEGTDPERLLRDTTELLAAHSLFNAHPLFFGYITSPPSPIGILGDFLAAGINANVGGWRLSPVASEIEGQTVRWIAELMGYPVGCGGLFVSGGNMANLTAFFAARAAKADWDVQRHGMNGPGSRPMRVYASGETHTWLEKAVELAGLGAESICWIPVDSRSRMDLNLLRAAIEADAPTRRQEAAAGSLTWLPFMVVATAGTVGTGAIDPLDEIADLCQEHGLWFHVDGAYGALAAMVPGAPADLAAIARADSVAVDPHKWLYAPLEAGCVLVRERQALRRAFSHLPAYYQFGEEETNYFEYGPQNSRGFRALKVWLALRQVGRSGYQRMIADDIELAGRLHRRLEADPRFEALTCSLSICTFRYLPERFRDHHSTARPPHASESVPRGAPRDSTTKEVEAAHAAIDALNRELVERVQRSGEAFVSNAMVGGRYALRACIVNFHTEDRHVDALPDILARIGGEIERERSDEEGTKL